MFIKVYTRNDVINAMNTYNTMHSFRKAAKQIGNSKSTIHVVELSFLHRNKKKTR